MANVDVGPIRNNISRKRCQRWRVSLRVMSHILRRVRLLDLVMGETGRMMRGRNEWGLRGMSWTCDAKLSQNSGCASYIRLNEVRQCASRFDIIVARDILDKARTWSSIFRSIACGKLQEPWYVHRREEDSYHPTIPPSYGYGDRAIGPIPTGCAMSKLNQSYAFMCNQLIDHPSLRNRISGYRGSWEAWWFPNITNNDWVMQCMCEEEIGGLWWWPS